jgi:hypothetical protein
VEEYWPCPVFASFYPGICLTTEEKARKSLSQSKKSLSQVKKSLSQVKKNLSQVKKNLSQSTVYILPKQKFLYNQTTQPHVSVKVIIIIIIIIIIINVVVVVIVRKRSLHDMKQNITKSCLFHYGPAATNTWHYIPMQHTVSTDVQYCYSCASSTVIAL